MNHQAKKYQPRRMQRRWEDAVVLALVAVAALVAGALISATSARAADILYKQSFAFVPSNETLAIQPNSLVLSPDSRRAYVAYPLDGKLVYFSIDSAGRWQKNAEYSASPTNGLAAPVQISISHDESRLYVLGNPNTLAEFAIDAATGEPVFKKLHTNGSGALIGLVAPAGIVVSPGDAHVYVTSSGDHRVLVFARQPDGDLVFVNSWQDGTGGVDGLNGADQIAISADGKSVYASSSIEHSIATFTRDTVTGALTFVNVLIDGVSGVDGLSGAHAIVVSDDGKYVYAAGLGEDAIAVFQRNTATGALSPYKVYRNGDLSGVVTIRGLNRITALRLAPHRHQLYAVSALESALVVFQRDPATGDLTLQDVLSDGIDTVDGLLEPLDLVVDPQNHYLYSISTEQKIGQFEVTNAPPVAVDDTADATVGETSAINVLGNDTDADVGDHLRVVGVASTALTKGKVALVNGQVMFTPAVCANVTADEFKYTIADARGTNSAATVHVTINTTGAINNPPVAMNDAVIVTRGTTANAIDVLANDSDPDADSVVRVVRLTSTSTKGTVVLDNGHVAYTPADSAAITRDLFTYTIADTCNVEATATVDVTINAPPVVMNDTTITDVNESVTIYVLANDNDPDADFRDTLSVAQFDTISQQRGAVNPENIPRSLLRVMAFPKVTALTYTPPAEFSGVDTFTYSVSDGDGGTATGTVTVIVGKDVGVTTQPPPAPITSGKKHRGANDPASLALLSLALLVTLQLRRSRRA